MFAWCLQKYGGIAPPEAEAEALRFYPYEPPSDPHRGLSFHDHAWHWAMLRIHGPHYWVKDRGLESPPDDYRVESEASRRSEPAREDL